MTKEEYERDLKERQRIHLEKVNRYRNQHWTPCMHETCPQCVGTGVKVDGSTCIHMMYCTCPKCSPITTCFSTISTVSTTYTTKGDTQVFAINEDLKFINEPTCNLTETD